MYNGIENVDDVYRCWCECGKIDRVVCKLSTLVWLIKAIPPLQQVDRDKELEFPL